MPARVPRKVRQHAPVAVGRVTFVIQAENRGDVLARVVMLFHRLNVEIQALYMVRRQGSETMRVNLTIDADQKGVRRFEANLYKVANVMSVKIERDAKELLDPDEAEARPRFQR